MHFFFQMCLSARLPRNADKVESKATKITSPWADSSEEDINEVANEFEKLLQSAEKKEFRKIVAEVDEAKTLEQALEGMVSFIIKL